jgi:hypothetical protein
LDEGQRRTLTRFMLLWAASTVARIGAELDVKRTS